MNRLKKLAGLITEHHGKQIASTDDYSVEQSGDTCYIYHFNKVVLKIPYDDLFELSIDVTNNRNNSASKMKANPYDYTDQKATIGGPNPWDK